MNNTRNVNGDRNVDRQNQNQGRERNASNGLNNARGPEVRGSMDKQPRPRAFNPVPYTKEESDNIQELLDKVLGPEYVSFRPGGGGQSVSYIEGWKALNLANEIFGFNGWSSELISSQVDFFDTHGNSGRYSMGLSVVVRITIKDGTYHEDFGYGYIDNAKSKAMAFEKCRKEAFTDGLKRCLRCFGNVLGNCLYDKTIISKIQKVKLPPVQLESDHFHRDPLLVKREIQKKQSNSVNILEKKHEFTEPLEAPNKATTTTPVNEGGIVARESRNVARPEGSPSHLLKSANKSTIPMKSMEIVGDFDDSFVFSDDLPAEGDMDMVTDGLDDYDMEMIMADEARKNTTANGESKSAEPETEVTKENNNIAEVQVNVNSLEVMNAPPLFVSAKRADFLQETPEAASKVPQFDTKFISPSIRRTLDPNKSVPIKRSEVQNLVNGNGIKSKLLNKNGMINKPSITTPSSVGKRLVGLPPSQKPPIKRLHKDISPSQSSNTERELWKDKENQI